MNPYKLKNVAIAGIVATPSSDENVAERNPGCAQGRGAPASATHHEQLDAVAMDPNIPPYDLHRCLRFSDSLRGYEMRKPIAAEKWLKLCAPYDHKRQSLKLKTISNKKGLSHQVPKHTPIINPYDPRAVHSEFFKYHLDPNKHLLLPDITFPTQSCGQPMQDVADKMDVTEDSEDMKMDVSMSESMSD